MAQFLTRRAVLAGAAVLAASGVAYAGYVEPAMRLGVTRYRPRPSAWPAGFRLSIAVLTDFHIGEPLMGLGRIEQIVDRTNALGADLIVLLGDYPVGGMPFVTRPVAMADCARRLAELKAPLGVFGVLGNHDWWDDETAQFRRIGPTNVSRALEAVGLPVLENRAVRLEKDGQGFWLAGLGDMLAFPIPGSDRFMGVDDLPATLAQCEGGDPAILIVHEPDIFPRVPDRIAITLSGHTHGGQVRLFGYSPIVPSQFGNRFAYGHVVESGRHMIVAGGLGCSRFPVRFGVPPEIVRVDLGS